MPDTDPTGRNNSQAAGQEQRNLEYLQGMAKGPMGWPATPPTDAYIEPAAIERMLADHPPDASNSKNPWRKPRNVIIAVVLFAILFATLAALILYR